MNASELMVYVPYSYAARPDVTGFDLAVYCYARLETFGSLTEIRYCNAESIAMYLYGDLKKTDLVRASMKKVDILHFVGKDCFQVANEGFLIRSSFVIIPFSVVEQIASSKYEYKWNLLKMYVIILSGYDYHAKTIDGRPYVADKPQAWYAAAMGVKSNLTIAKYVKALEELQIIYAHRSRKPHVNTLLGLYENRTLIAQYAGKQHNVIQTSDSNHKRSLMQKYNAMLRGKKYDPDTIAEVKAYILSYNAEQEELQRQHPDDDYLALRKDVSVFT